MSPRSAHVTEEQRRGNLVWLAVLVALILGLMLLSAPLFNNYWDPGESRQTISH